MTTAYTVRFDEQSIRCFIFELVHALPQKSRIQTNLMLIVFKVLLEMKLMSNVTMDILVLERLRARLLEPSPSPHVKVTSYLHELQILQGRTMSPWRYRYKMPITPSVGNPTNL